MATPGESTIRCGGNTPCIEVRCDSRVIILDAGTGIRELGVALEKEGVTEMDLLISHPHMDHLQGFPFFNPAYNSATRLTIHLSDRGAAHLSDPFSKLMEQPHFPVLFHHLPACIHFQELNGPLKLGAVCVSTHPVNHPGGCLAFRLEYRGKVFVYMTDHEPYARMYGESHEDRQEHLARDRELRDFIADADLLVREAQYTIEEYELKHGWGHGTFDDAVSDAIQARVKRLALFHHDPSHGDRFLERELGDLQFRYGDSSTEVFLAREGQCVELG